jgi:beta-lactamase superfamily II metal-dependent hydrolase
MVKFAVGALKNTHTQPDTNNMKIKVTVINVEDGDSIIVELNKPRKSLVMLIDGGKTGKYATAVKPQLDKILREHKKTAPDVVVCTHYDRDHIGGLIKLIEDKGDAIKEVWVHKTPELINGVIDDAEEHLNSPSRSGSSLLIEAISAVNTGNKVLDSLAVQHIQEVYESIGDLRTFLKIISKKTKVRHDMFHGLSPLKGWPEIKILGPTKTYFEELFPANKSKSRFLLDETIGMHVHTEGEAPRRAAASPCDALKTDAAAKITPTNRASIIIAIDDAKRRYLFTGDAGVESFKRIPNWQTELKDLYFLKIPHHGSNNNMTKEISEVMQPVFAYNSGAGHTDAEVLDCFKSKSRCKDLRSTEIEKTDLVFHPED